MRPRWNRNFWRETEAAMIPIKETPQGITLTVKVQPRARRSAITGRVGDAIKLALTAPPVAGKANDALIDFLAEFFDIPRSSVTISSGQTRRLKIVRITGVAAGWLHRRLATISGFSQDV